MVREIGLIALLIGGWIGFNWLKKQPKQTRWQWIAIIAAVILIGLALTGRLHWVYALIAAIIPLFRKVLGLLSYLPLLKSSLNQFRNSPGEFSFDQQSSLETRYIKIKLDPTTSKLSGIIKQGQHAGENLQDLSLPKLITLLTEYSKLDPESAQLLSAYLDHSEHTAWRSHYHQEEPKHRHTNTNNTSMTLQEACSILGLHEDASKKEILEAHRRLIQKLHPDRGGNDYLAAKVNQAKSVLIK
jgi:hypothetical protein